MLLSLLSICPCSRFYLGACASGKGNHVSGPTWLISESNACCNNFDLWLLEITAVLHNAVLFSRDGGEEDLQASY